jgi:hypothetical protein
MRKGITGTKDKILNSVRILNFDSYVNESLSQQDLAMIEDMARLKFVKIDQLKSLISLGLVQQYYVNKEVSTLVKSIGKKFTGFKLSEILVSDTVPTISKEFNEIADATRSDEFKTLLSMGLHLVSTDQQILNGTLVLSFTPNYRAGKDKALGLMSSSKSIREFAAAHSSKTLSQTRSDLEFYLAAFRWVNDNLDLENRWFENKKTISIDQVRETEVSALTELTNRLVMTKIGQISDFKDLVNELLMIFEFGAAKERRKNIQALTKYFNGERIRLQPSQFVYYNQRTIEVLSDPLISVEWPVQQLMTEGSITDLSGLTLKVASHLHSLSLSNPSENWRETSDVLLDKLYRSGLRSIKYYSVYSSGHRIASETETDAELKKHGITLA